MAQKVKTSDALGKYDDGRALLDRAIKAAFQIYSYQGLEGHLKTSGWRKARRQVLGNGALSGEWVRRGGSEVRLSRRGLEVRLPGEGSVVSWQNMWEFARGRGR